MIQNDGELEQSLAQVERMYRMLAEFRRRIAPLSEANYQVMAEGPIDEIRRLQREIDDYLRIQQPASAISG